MTAIEELEAENRRKALTTKLFRCQRMVAIGLALIPTSITLAIIHIKYIGAISAVWGGFFIIIGAFCYIGYKNGFGFTR